MAYRIETPSNKLYSPRVDADALNDVMEVFQLTREITELVTQARALSKALGEE